MRPRGTSLCCRPSVLGAVGLAVSLHAALAVVWWAGSPRAVAQTASASPMVVFTRMMAPLRGTTATLQAQGPAQTSHTGHTGLASGEASPPGPAAMAEATEASADTEATETTEAPYYPRPELDIGPQAKDPVLIAYPEGVDTAGPHTGRLSLFIDEAGIVRKVDIQPTEPPLPQAMQDAARQAFLQAQFWPGQRQGAIVRSRIDIEVTFDDRPLDSLEAEARNSAPQHAGSSGA
jgi:periplasmic protein TonB